mgnify:CR=1 FL=1
MRSTSRAATEAAFRMSSCRTLSSVSKAVWPNPRPVKAASASPIEAVGTPETFNQAITLIRRNGTVIYFGIPDKTNKEALVKLPFREIFGKEARFITSAGPDPEHDYTAAVQWIVEGRIDVRPIVTHVLPIEEIQAGFDMAFANPQEQKPIKIVLRF